MEVVKSKGFGKDVTQQEPKKELHPTWKSLLIVSLVLSILDLLGGLIAIIVLVSQIPKLKDYDLNASDLNAVKGVMVFFIFFIVVAMCFNSLNIFLVTKNLKSKEAKYLSGLPVLWFFTLSIPGVILAIVTWVKMRKIKEYHHPQD